MVAYNFIARFVSMVQDGRKNQTIRAGRKRHARVGEPVQLYTGMRTAACRKLRDPDPECLMCKPIRIKARTISIGDLAVTGAKLLWRPDELERFAKADGFDSHADMIDWFNETHGLPFEGWLIGWAPLNGTTIVSAAVEQRAAEEALTRTMWDDPEPALSPDEAQQ